jgi:HK97 family phage major capsid protein
MAENNHSDAMVSRLEKEIEERNAFIEGTVANAQDAERDLTENETELIGEAQKRIEVVEQQLRSLDAARESTRKARKRADDLQKAMAEMRYEVDKGEVEYRTAGEWIADSVKAHNGNRDAQERMEMFVRAAAHQTTGDNAGVIPEPIVGNVINFIDAARPLVSAIGPQPLTSDSWKRPRVTQSTSVDVQGAAGLAADEKTELVSQKMLISSLTANAVTYGGYVNVSRQNIDFSNPQILDIVVNDLAAQYAIQTEAATAAEIEATATAAVGYGTAGNETDRTVAAALWSAAASAYTAVKGQGRLILAVSPGALGTFGPLFAPVSPRDAQSTGFSAGSFGQGGMGAISGIQVVMSAGLTAGTAYVFSTAAIEVFEQRVGSLQVTEPSVLGLQVAYAGYFTPLTIEDDAIIPLTAT